jgi:hypothetical protein
MKEAYTSAEEGTRMRFLVMLKANKDSEAGIMPGEERTLCPDEGKWIIPTLKVSLESPMETINREELEQ